MTTVAQALRDAAARLADVSDTARLDAELMMEGALAMPRSAMLLRARDLAAPTAFTPMLARRLGGEPVAYIMGRQDFYGRSFIVNPHVLIPRADSETIVEAALPLCDADTRILDCGTGSGALLLTVVAERRGSHGIGVDACPDAIGVAQANARALNLDHRVRMLERDWMLADWCDGLGTFNLVLANPPYVKDAATLGPGVREYEPARALFAGRDGLADYRALLPHMDALLAPGGAAIIEIGHDQAAAVEALAAQAGFTARLLRDLADRARGLVLRRRM
ncbi:MAG: peptide chain release factor N(5)-glutamine methyltransferase [Pontixanthobacter sp.]